MRKLTTGSIILSALLVGGSTGQADVLCKVKRTGAVIARPSVCTRKELAIATLTTSSTSTSSAADLSIGNSFSVSDTGPVSGGSDTNVGLDLSMNRLNASGGNINTTGMNISVAGDTGGDSTAIGLSVQTTGADSNYTAIFQGGNVGINVSDPDEALEVAGRVHLGQTSSPGDVSDKLYNVGGSLFWSGQRLGIESKSEGAITGVTAGTGLAGGGTSGNVTLSIDSGTSAGKVVQLNASAELPAVSGANLTALNATSVTSGLISDARLSPNVSLLGAQISLSGEVDGILPVANGGIGATTLSNLITLGSHTSGDYVSSLSAGTGINLSPSTASEGANVTVSLDSAAAPSWSGVHSFLNGVNVGTAASSVESLHVNGRLHIEQTSTPAVTTDKLYNVGGSLFFNGLNISSNAAGGDITGITAGTGLIGGGTTGAVSLSVDVGTAAGDIVQLDGSAQLPAVSGVNLSNLNASNISSGTLAAARLPGTVSLLGSSIELTSEVSGVLPVANGGIGATSLADLIALGTHTTGNYVTSIVAGSGISVSNAGTESITGTVSLDQAFAPTWTNTHTFSAVAPDITTGVNDNFSIVPNGSGRIGFGTNSPGAFLHSSTTSTDGSAGNVIGNLMEVSDTGAVSSGADNTTGQRITLSRSGATGGTINSLGLDVAVTADTGGAALTTATGLQVSVGGADTNYAALFSGGRVGVGTTSPTSLFETSFTNGSTTASAEVANRLSVTDSGAITTGSDTTTGLSLAVNRSGATGGTIESVGLNIAVNDDAGGTSTTTALRASAQGGDTNYAAIFPAGFVGIGTTTPTSQFQSLISAGATDTTASSVVGNRFTLQDEGIVTTGSDSNTAVEITIDRTGATGGTIESKGLVIDLTGDNAASGAATFTGLDVTVADADNLIAARFAGGQVGIGASTTTLTDSDIASGSLIIGNGALCVDNTDDDCGAATRAAGSIYAEGASVNGIDLAEEFPIKDGDNVEAGDIVVAATEKGSKCIARSRDDKGVYTCTHTTTGFIPFITRSKGDSAEAKRVLGVVSSEPGVTLGGYGRQELFGYKTVPLALAGRIPVKVNDENGPIEVGDRITPSSEPGVGMRANEGDLVVGIALEPHMEGRGMVVTLVK